LASLPPPSPRPPKAPQPEPRARLACGWREREEGCVPLDGQRRKRTRKVDKQKACGRKDNAGGRSASEEKGREGWPKA